MLHRRPLRRLLCPALVFALSLATASGTALAQPQPEPQRVTLSGVMGELRYDIEEFTVEAGRPVVLVFNNPSDMPHNVVICTPGEGMPMKVGNLVWDMEDPEAAQYVPETEMVLFHTRLVQPGESDTLRFDAPQEPGDYPYVCTVPGHPMTMNGVMHVVRSGQTRAAHAHHAAMTSKGTNGGPGPLADLTYQYFEGEWQKLPAFADLIPKSAGRLPNGRIELPRENRKDHIGVLYKAMLEVPADGEYVFLLRSDDGSRLRVDGRTVVDNDGLHPAQLRMSKPVKLSKGPHPFELAFFNAKGELDLVAAWRGPGLDGISPLSAGKGAEDFARFLVEVADRPLVYRVLLPDASSRSIAVGLPGGTSYCFDTLSCAVRYGWQGQFLDIGPQHGYGDNRGGGTVGLLGDRFEVGYTDKPLRIGDPSREPEVRFIGYERRGDASPRFVFSVDGVEVKQTIEAVAGKAGLRYVFEFETSPDKPVYFHVQPKDVEVTATAGTWNQGVLEVPPSDAQRFEITMLPGQS